MKTIRSRLLLAFCAMLLGFGAVFSFLYYLNLRQEIIKGFDERLRSHAEDIAGLLDVAAHERLRQEAQIGNEDYLRLYGQLNRLMKQNGLAYIFTIRQQNGHWAYVLDSGEGEDHLPLGTLYNEGRPLDPDEQEALTGRTVVSAVYSSRYGTFKSAYTPLRDREGKTVGLLVVDIEASTIAATLRARLLSLAGFQVALLLLVILVSTAVSNSITRPLHRMAERAGRVAAGDLEMPVANRRRDEIGTVSRAIDTMVQRLKQMIAEREAAAGELARFNRTLEQLVAERTQALADSESRYRLLTEQAFVGIYLIQDGRFRYVNPAMAAMMGYDREELMDREVALLIQPRDRELFQENVRRRLEGEVESLQYTLHYLRPNGAEGILEVAGARTEYHGRPAIYGTARDVTEQRQLEEMLRRSQRLEGLGQIAGGIAHEFNNLLSPILGYADLLKNRIAQLGREDLLRPLALIEKAGRRATALVREILTFARKTSWRLSPVDLNDVVEETIALLGQTLPRNIEIRSQLEPDLPLVEAEAGQIQSALLNLCLNARDAMPEGGCLTLSTRSVELEGEWQRLSPQAPPGRYVQVTVEDSGVGIEESVLPRIFDPFFSTKKDSGGTGLGLATVYGTVQSHQGQVTVDSQPGRGSQFCIYLPATEKEVCSRPQESAHRPRGSEPLLVVDDEEDVRSLYAEALRELGYSVAEAADGEQALGILAGNSIRLVLLDMNMPRLGGRQTLAEIRRRAPGLPVVVTSGMGEFDGPELTGDRLSAFLPKPFGLETLAQKVRQLLDLAAGRPPSD